MSYTTLCAPNCSWNCVMNHSFRLLVGISNLKYVYSCAAAGNQTIGRQCGPNCILAGFSWLHFKIRMELKYNFTFSWISGILRLKHRWHCARYHEQDAILATNVQNCYKTVKHWNNQKWDAEYLNGKDLPNNVSNL